MNAPIDRGLKLLKIFLDDFVIGFVEMNAPIDRGLKPAFGGWLAASALACGNECPDR